MGVYTILKEDEKNYLEKMYSKKFEKIIMIEKGILNSNFLIYSSRISNELKLDNDCEILKDTLTCSDMTQKKGKEEKYILRIFEASRTLEEEKQEIEFLNLISDFIPVSLAIKNIENEYISTYNGKKYSLFHYIEGENILIPSQLNIREIGMYLGKIHKFSKNLEQKKYNRKTRIDFNFYFNEFKNNFIKSDKLKDINFFLDENDKQKLFSLGEEIEKIDFSFLPSGIIHGDIFPDNVLTDGNSISAILDFNEINYSPFVFDIAAVINFWIKFYKYPKLEENDRIRDFFNNYSRYRKIEREELKLLQLACKKVALTFIFLRIYKESMDKKYLNAVDIEKKSYKELMFLLD